MPLLDCSRRRAGITTLRLRAEGAAGGAAVAGEAVRIVATAHEVVERTARVVVTLLFVEATSGSGWWRKNGGSVAGGEREEKDEPPHLQAMLQARHAHGLRMKDLLTMCSSVEAHVSPPSSHPADAMALQHAA